MMEPGSIDTTDSASPSSGATAVVAGTGASVFALLATSCCVPILAPLIVSILGVSGAVWAAGLKPYALWALAVGGVFLAYGHWRVWTARRHAVVCRNRRRTWVVGILWTATALWAVAGILNGLQALLPRLL